METAKSRIMSMNARAFVREFVTDERTTNAIWDNGKDWSVKSVYRNGTKIRGMGKRSLKIFQDAVDKVIEEVAGENGLGEESFEFMLEAYRGSREDAFSERVQVEEIYQLFKDRLRREAMKEQGVKQLEIEEPDQDKELYLEEVKRKVKEIREFCGALSELHGVVLQAVMLVDVPDYRFLINHTKKFTVPSYLNEWRVYHKLNEEILKDKGVIK